MKKTLLFSFAVMFASYINAQDQLFKKDNSKLLVSILEINPTEIKYKMFDNPNGPVYTERISNVSMIIYQDGRHEVIGANIAPAPHSVVPPPAIPQIENLASYAKRRYKEDSLVRYGHSNNVSLNLLNFLNREVGLMYQHDFFKRNFNIQIPVSFGVGEPDLTQGVYFGNMNNNYNNYYYNTSNYSYNLNKKKFDVGLGINYYPFLDYSNGFNYYMGVMFKYSQFDGTQNYTYSIGNYNYSTISKNSTLVCYAGGITNGFIIRSRSRLTLALHATIGLLNSTVSNSEKIKDPNTNIVIEPFKNETSLFFSPGFNIGFSF